MPICFAKLGDNYKIKKIYGSQEIKQHLADLGLHIGSQITVIAENKDDMIVEVKGSRIAIGKELTKRIYI